jgi:polyhydroxybutyrate depolymerase
MIPRALKLVELLVVCVAGALAVGTGQAFSQENGERDTSSLVRRRAIVRRAGATLNFAPLSRFLEATARTEGWPGAAMVVLNRYGVLLYQKEIGELALWKPVVVDVVETLSDAVVGELSNGGWISRRGEAWTSEAHRFGDLLVVILNGGMADEKRRLSPEAVKALAGTAGPWHDLGDGFGAVFLTSGAVNRGTSTRVIELARAITAGERIDPERWQVEEGATETAGTSDVPDVPALTIEVDGEERTYLLFMPSRRAEGEPLPLVVMLHAGGRSGRQALERTRWDLTAEREGFLVAFPDGGWNDGSGRGGQRDDVAFIAALIDEVATRRPVDRDRVYLTGMALGASMTFRAGYELADRIAAIAPVTGHFMLEDPPSLDPPVSMICFIGTEDVANPMRRDVVRISGGTGIRKPYVRDSVLKWVEVLGLPLRSTLLYAGDGIFQERFGPGPRGDEAILYIIEGMGFQWPGGTALIEERLGKGTDRIRATDVIWEFFRRHARDSVAMRRIE